MLVLAWLSVAVLLLFLALFAFWSWKEKRATEKLLARLFFGGTALFFVLFLAFSWDSLNTIRVKTHEEALTAEVVAGKLAWQKYVCIDCHTIQGTGAYYGPDLTRAFNRFLGRSGGDRVVARHVLASYLRNPPRASSDTRGMSSEGITADEAVQLTAFLEWHAGMDLNGWPPPPIHELRPTAAAGSPVLLQPLAAQGKEIFEGSGCAGCHSVGGGAVIGPDLLGVGAKYNQATLLQWILDPDAVYMQRGRKPINSGFPEMPRFELNQEDARAVVAYLVSTERKEQ